MASPGFAGGVALALAAVLLDANPAGARPRRIDPLAALAPSAEARIARRAHLARLGPARFTSDGERVDEQATPTALDEVVLVADENAQRVQIRTAQDGARMLLWIDRADLVTVIDRTTALVDPATGKRGATARRGAMVTRVDPATTATRTVTISDGAISATGVVPAAALATTYDRKVTRSTTTSLLAAGAIVRAEPRVDGRPIATATTEVSVRAIGAARDGWIEIEIDRDAIYARGYAPADAVTSEDGYGLGGLGTMGYGMSDTVRVLVPAKTCLYASPGGPIVGITTATQERYAQGVPDEVAANRGEWRTVAVGTTWGVVWPAVRLARTDPSRTQVGCR